MNSASPDPGNPENGTGYRESEEKPVVTDWDNFIEKEDGKKYYYNVVQEFGEMRQVKSETTGKKQTVSMKVEY